MSGGQSPGAGARIGTVDRGIGPTVECHRSGSCRDHRNHNPYQLMRGRKTSSSKHCSAEGKRERKDRVLPLDHLQRDAQIMQNRHESIVMQVWISIFGPRSRLWSP